MITDIRVLRSTELRRSRWRNGLGTTSEVAANTDTRDHMTWRVSIADLDGTPTAFSRFDRADRMLTVVGPHAVTLEWPDRTVEVLPWTPYRFPGDDPPVCTPSGATRALNVITDRTAAAAIVDVVHLDERAVDTKPGEVTVLYVRAGTASAPSMTAHRGDCVIVRHDMVNLVGNASGLLVRIAIPTDHTSRSTHSLGRTCS